MNRLDHFVLSQLETVIADHSAQKICDYGCGKGEFLQKLTEQLPELHFTGIDFFNKYNIPTNDDANIHFIDRDSEAFSHLSNLPTFDLLFSTFSLHHFRYPITELQLISRLLKPNGIMLFIDYAFQNESQAEIVKNISSFLEEMGAAIKGGYHRHHYTLAEAQYLLKAAPVNVLDAQKIKIELSESEKQTSAEQKIKRNARIQQNISRKAPEFWKKVWLPFFEQEEKLLREIGVDYTSCLVITAQKEEQK